MGGRPRLDYTSDVQFDPVTGQCRSGTTANNQRLDARPQTRFSDNTYGQVLDAIPVPCVDVVLINPNGQVLLGLRQQQPHPDWWIIGGRMYARETYLDAATRSVARELGIYLASDRFDSIPLGVWSLVWDTRQQPPQEKGCHNISLPFVYWTTYDEAGKVWPDQEYARLEWWDPTYLLSQPGGTFHPVLIDIVNRATKRQRPS